MNISNARFSGLLLSFVLLGAACSEQSNRLPRDADFTGGVSNIVAVPVGPFPRGQADPTFALDQTTVGPEITVLSPDRGAQVTTDTVTIRVRVEDPNGVSDVRIAGIAAAPVGNSEFSATVSMLREQVNEMVVEATDSLGNIADAHFSMVHATAFHDINTPMSRAVGLSLSNPALAKIEGIMEDQLKTLDILPFIAASNPIVQNVLADVYATSLSHDPLKVTIQGEPTGLFFSADIDNFDLGVLVDTFIVNFSPNLIADRMTITAHCEINPTGVQGTSIKSALGLEITQVDVDFVNFDVVHSNFLTNAILGLLTTTVRNLVSDEIKSLVVDTADQQLAQALPGLGAPIPVALPLGPLGTSSVDLQFAADEAQGSAATGVGMALGFSATPSLIALPNATTNVFQTNTTVIPTVQTGDAFALGVSSDACNLFMHAFWLGGGLQMVIDGKDVNEDATFAINAKLLTPFFPPLRGLAPDPTTPIILEISAAAPPVASFGRSASAIALTIMEFELKISIDYMDGQPPLEVMTLRTGLEAGVDIDIVNDAIVISNIQVPSVTPDLMREPVADISDAELENFLNALMPFILDRLKLQIPPIPIPALPFNLSLQNPRFDVQQDFLLIRGGL